MVRSFSASSVASSVAKENQWRATGDEDEEGKKGGRGRGKQGAILVAGAEICSAQGIGSLSGKTAVRHRLASAVGCAKTTREKDCGGGYYVKTDRERRYIKHRKASHWLSQHGR